MPPRFECRIEGVDALRRAFAELPKDLADDASVLALWHAQMAQGEIKPVYQAHRVTGNLARGLVIRQTNAGRYAKAVMIKSGAHHAHLFEDGTNVRQTRNHANRGAARPHPTFRAPVHRVLVAFNRDLADLLRRAGLNVPAAAA